jgi:uncharacterized protein (TIGR03437 family)
MHRRTLFVTVGLLILGQVYARQDRTICGTTREKLKEQLHLHRQAEKMRRAAALEARDQIGATRPGASKDIGDIAILDDSDGVVARLNEFNLDQKTVTFSPTSPAAGRYRFNVSHSSYDLAAATFGVRIGAFEDDDTRQFSLKFQFPFFGASYQEVFVNSDGNLTFTAGDVAISERSLGRMTAGPPRIAGLFRDLDPSKSAQGVTVSSALDRFVVSWVTVPQYQENGIGPLQTFQIRLFPDGRIEFAYAGIGTSSALVGISPGRLQGSSAVISFLNGSSQEFSSTVAERFGRYNEVDVVSAAQKFYAAHDDGYDYLVFFNNMGIDAAEGAVSWELTLRNSRSGYGDAPADAAAEFGSARRLQAVLNMGPLDQFPNDPNAIVAARTASRDTPLSVLAHEAGHLFLAYASVRDPQDPRARPMLGYQAAHWAFVFNSEASLLEGNRIRDNWENRPGAYPRFTTVGVTEGFSPLDQYLMGLRAPEEVPPTFLVTGSGLSPLWHPQLEVSFGGERRDIQLGEVIRAEGRRTPDHTVAQRRFRFAFILITGGGADPTASELQKIDTFRKQFETYFRTATSDGAWADTSLRRSLRLSTFPAAGVVRGGSMPASLSLEKAAEAKLTVDLRALNGLVSVPSSVTIPAGAVRADFTISGARGGVDELMATPADSRYETAYSRVQVASSVAELKLVLVSGGKQVATPGIPLPAPIVLRATDVNDLPYPGLPVQASVTAGGVLRPASATTDENGMVRFLWTPGPGPLNQLAATLEGAPPSSALVVPALGKPYFAPWALVNAASHQAGISPGCLATLYGVNFSGGAAARAAFPWPDKLAEASVSLDGRPVPLLFVSDQQINFLVPAGLRPGTAELVVSTPLGPSPTARVALDAVSPGIFFVPATGLGAVQVAGSGQTTAQSPARQGDFIEIYATGLGPVHSESGFQRTDLNPEVSIAGVRATELNYSGLAPGWLGLYQVNARIPSGVPAGLQPLSLSIGGKQSNEVKIQIR